MLNSAQTSLAHWCRHLEAGAPVRDFWGSHLRTLLGQSAGACPMPSHTLQSATHDWYCALDNGDEVGTEFFDFCKAFDKVPHNPLFQSMSFN